MDHATRGKSAGHCFCDEDVESLFIVGVREAIQSSDRYYPEAGDSSGNFKLARTWDLF